MQKLIVIRPVTGLAREFVHVRRPARRSNRLDREGVNGRDTILPLLGGLVNNMGFAKSTDLSLDAFLLFQQHSPHFQISNARQHTTLHDGTALVILDITHPDGPIQGNFLSKTLFLKVPDGIVIRVCEEVHHVRGSFDVVLEMGHEMGAIAFDLLVRRDSAEDDLGKVTPFEWAIGDTADDFERFLDDRDGEMGPVVDESRNIVLGHLRQLFLKYALQSCKDYETFPLVIVVDNTEFYFAIAFFDYSRLSAMAC